jgi:hypothetical protein
MFPIYRIKSANFISTIMSKQEQKEQKEQRELTN